MPSADQGLSYRDAGVDIDASNRAKERIRGLLRDTATEGTLSELGAFGGLFRVPGGMRSPVLVASTDGVGTKLKVAFMADRHDTVGEDLVNHCVNDILVQGARPLFFLDYLGMGKVEPGAVAALVEGVARGCRANGCALLGGETAEMPDFYEAGEYDLAGTVVGIVEEERILDGSAVSEGDLIVALPSSGLHTNGYSLARRIVFERMGLGVADPFPGEEGATVAEVLLRVHRSYLETLWPLIEAERLKALAHVTGGGIVENLPRVLPQGLGARIRLDSWHVPNLFRVLQEEGRVEESEMYRAFNMGVGMMAVVAPEEAAGVVEALGRSGEEAWVVGEVIRGSGIELS
jgi:phosphoribosylformylglycinamidine cyclo-ligase